MKNGAPQANKASSSVLNLKLTIQVLIIWMFLTQPVNWGFFFQPGEHAFLLFGDTNYQSKSKRH